MSDNMLAVQQCPQEWIELRDIESLSFERSTWIPLMAAEIEFLKGRIGTAGFRRGYRSIESLIVPTDQQAEFQGVDWQSLMRNTGDSAWADEKTFLPPGCFHDDPRVLRPVLQRSFDTDEPTHWDILQELEVGLSLIRRGDTWVRPDENDVDVAKLERDGDGSPSVLLIRAEHLRDYLCAKRATLLLTGFATRTAVEEQFSSLSWNGERVGRNFSHGEWDGTHIAIHEGGGPFGSQTNVLRMWRESVNPRADLPEMPQPWADAGARAESFVVKETGRKLFSICGRIWIKHWIQPATNSPRIRNDKIPSRVHFQVENQEQKTLAGDALETYRGWLWFQPLVIRRILDSLRSRIKWFTENTGEVGPGPNHMLHFGVNRIGLINVLGCKMAHLPEWAQRIWATENVCPDGGLSDELHMTQNLVQPTNTVAPEAILWHNLRILQKRSQARFKKPLLQQFPSEREFFNRVHRFYCESLNDVCVLAKELHRLICEAIDIGLLNERIDPANAATAKKNKLRQIKRVALWLDGLSPTSRIRTT